MTSWEEKTYKDAPSEVSGTTVSCADGVEEWDVRWIVCSNRSPISEPLLRVLRLLPEVRAVVAATSLKKRTIDGMTVVNGVHSSPITISYEGSVRKQSVWGMLFCTVSVKVRNTPLHLRKLSKNFRLWFSRILFLSESTEQIRMISIRI